MGRGVPFKGGLGSAHINSIATYFLNSVHLIVNGFFKNPLFLMQYNNCLHIEVRKFAHLMTSPSYFSKTVFIFIKSYIKPARVRIFLTYTVQMLTSNDVACSDDKLRWESSRQIAFKVHEYVFKWLLAWLCTKNIFVSYIKISESSAEVQ